VSRLVCINQRNGAHDAEHCISLTTILDGFVNDPMLDGHLVGACFAKVRHPGIVVAEVYLSETLIK